MTDPADDAAITLALDLVPLLDRTGWVEPLMTLDDADLAGFRDIAERMLRFRYSCFQVSVHGEAWLGPVAISLRGRRRLRDMLALPHGAGDWNRLCHVLDVLPTADAFAWGVCYAGTDYETDPPDDPRWTMNRDGLPF